MQRRMFLAGMGALALPANAYAQRGAPIIPENELERAFVAALSDPAARPLFRRALMASQVALAMASSAADSAPREVALQTGAAAAVFTSAGRLNGVLGPAAARRMLTGRAAFERLQGQRVVLNYRLVPMLTLDPEDVAAYLGA